MKFPFFKAVLLAGAMLTAWNCSDDSLPSTLPGTGYEPAKEIEIQNGDKIYISEDNSVKDGNGNVIGTYNPETGTITDTNGNVLVEGVNKDELNDATIPTPGAPDMGNNQGGSGAGTDNGNTPGSNLGGNGAGTGMGSGTGTGAGTGSDINSGNGSGNVASSGSGNASSGNQGSGTTTNPPQNTEGKCFDSASGSYVDPWANLKGPHDEQYQYNNECKLTCHYDPTNNGCGSMGTGSVKPSSSASQQQPKSSSSVSQPKSSSSVSQPKSSSSQKRSSSSVSMPNGTTPNFAIKNGGISGQGWGSRYWDCCKPHCAWSGKGGPIARTCNKQQQSLIKGDDTQTCAHEGGNAGVCNDQRPIIINEKLAYAYAAGKGAIYERKCGTCLLLTFDGNSRHTSDNRTKALNGKQMVIMISNIGYDVEDGQFDLMIPGGGFGLYNACTNHIGLQNIGAQYGGILVECKGDVVNDDVEGVQRCMEEKCNSYFGSIPDLKAGCLFHAQWLMAANNPSFKYQELESCPKELLDRY